MRQVAALLLVALGGCLVASATHDLKSVATGFEYRLHVLVPDGYEDSPRHYPVVYVTDAHMALEPIRSSYGELVETGAIEPAILVVIGYVRDAAPEMHRQRWRDLTPTRDIEAENYWSERLDSSLVSGGAGRFLVALRREILPFVEERYRVSDDRSYIGYSFGGLFGAYALLHEPELFGTYILGSASLWWGGGVAHYYEGKYDESHDALPARVHFTYGSDESADIAERIPRLIESMKRRNYQNLELVTHIFEGRDHGSAMPDTYRYALEQILAPDS